MMMMSISSNGNGNGSSCNAGKGSTCRVAGLDSSISSISSSINSHSNGQPQQQQLCGGAASYLEDYKDDDDDDDDVKQTITDSLTGSRLSLVSPLILKNLSKSTKDRILLKTRFSPGLSGSAPAAPNASALHYLSYHSSCNLYSHHNSNIPRRRATTSHSNNAMINFSSSNSYNNSNGEDACNGSSNSNSYRNNSSNSSNSSGSYRSSIGSTLNSFASLWGDGSILSSYSRQLEQQQQQQQLYCNTAEEATGDDCVGPPHLMVTRSAPASVTSDSSEEVDDTQQQQSKCQFNRRGRNGSRIVHEGASNLRNARAWSLRKLINAKKIKTMFNNACSKTEKLINSNYDLYKGLLKERGMVFTGENNNSCHNTNNANNTNNNRSNNTTRKFYENAICSIAERRYLDFQNRSLSLAKRRKSRMKLRFSEKLRAEQLLSCEDQSKVVSAKFNIEINLRILNCLLPCEWLNDEIINFYLNLIQQRNDKAIENGELVPKTFIWSTFFYTKLTGEDEAGARQVYNFNNVKRWTKRKNVDLFSYDLILIPVHLKKIHWALGVIFVRDRRIHFFDSMSESSAGWDFYVNILQYLKDEHLDKKGEALVDEHSWSFDDREKYSPVPQQSNGSDCGIFVCQFCECLADGRSFDFSQSDIPNIRIKMVSQIQKGEVE